MSWLSKAIGVDLRLSSLAPGASASTIRKAIEGLRLDVPTLRIMARVVGELAAEKEAAQ